MPVDPWLACCITGCQTPVFSPADIFCQWHAARVPAEITQALEDQVKQQQPDLTAWRALLERARQAVAAAVPTT